METVSFVFGCKGTLLKDNRDFMFIFRGLFFLETPAGGTGDFAMFIFVSWKSPLTASGYISLFCLGRGGYRPQIPQATMEIIYILWYLF